MERERAATEELITSIMRLRRERGRHFGSDLFGDPAWDILLELFAAKLSGRKLRLADLELHVPKSTVARWAVVLEERGLISCRFDCRDSARMDVELSSAGEAKMAELFRSLHSHAEA